MNPKIRNILKRAKANMYKEVIHEYKALNDDEKSNPVVRIAYADSLYETGNDIEALEEYLEYAMQFPQGKAINFALFAAALSLKNLDMHEESLVILRMIDPNHKNVGKEIEHSSNLLNKQKRAKDIFRDYLKSKLPENG